MLGIMYMRQLTPSKDLRTDRLFHSLLVQYIIYAIGFSERQF